MELRIARSLITWMAAFAVLMTAVAPALSHAIFASAGSTLVEVCTERGSKWVDATTGEEKSNPGTAGSDTCGFCLLHCDLADLDASASWSPVVVDLARHVPQAFLSAPRVAHAWRAPHSRAPPQVG